MAARPAWRLARDKALASARREALNKLADLHPAEYIVLVRAECAAMGVEAPWVRPDGRPSGGAR